LIIFEWVLRNENRRNEMSAKTFIAKREKGQGLVEYALILVLVAVVVIVVLGLLGPTIGNVFSNVLTVLRNPGASASSCATVPTDCGYTACAIDLHTCNITGTRDVAWGANSTFIYLQMTNSFVCGGPAMPPDILPGTLKTCYVR
jgi:pilus assembly protein Flp/PilA